MLSPSESRNRSRHSFPEPKPKSNGVVKTPRDSRFYYYVTDEAEPPKPIDTFSEVLADRVKSGIRRSTLPFRRQLGLEPLLPLTPKKVSIPTLRNRSSSRA